MCPGQTCAGLGSKKVDRWFVHVGKAAPCFLKAQMGGYDPGGLLAGRPDSIRDLFKESTLALHCLSEDEVHECTSASVDDALVVAAVSDAIEFQVDCRREIGPFELEAPLPTFDVVILQSGG